MPLRKELKKVLVIGSGPIVIGQAAEFDYAGTQACLALKEEGIDVVLVNNNPATIMTDPAVADRIYLEPLTVETLEKIIRKERPDGLIGTLGGQTALNLTVQLCQEKILAKYGVALLGTSAESIQLGEDRKRFRQRMMEIGEPIPESKVVSSLEEGFQFVREIGYPVILRPAYTLGGTGGGFACNDEEFAQQLTRGLQMSPIHQVLVERSIKGWKEIEYEVMRDANDTCIIVCNMENLDPIGIHTGDSIVVAPSQTLSDVQHQMLRNSAIKVIRSLKIIGGCNIQFALDPHSHQYYVIEVNPRVSRSSALASKATGYPIARIAAKCAIGYHLDEIVNPITGTTFASFEPAIDYVVVKLPRFPFDKFPEGERKLGTQMKATGEVMAIDRCFEGALNKGIRSLEIQADGLWIQEISECSDEQLKHHLIHATDLRIFAIAEAFRRGWEIEELYHMTSIDRWFLYKIQGLISLEQELQQYTWESVPDELLKTAKKKNMSDAFLARLFAVPESEVRQKWKQLGFQPGYKQVDTCAAEFEAVTPYYYSTWTGTDEITGKPGKKILVIGSGPIRIGQGIEFDYCSVHAVKAVKKSGCQAILINNNPETVSTDYSVSDRLYFEPLTVEDILHVIEKERVDGVLVQFGGQTALNLAQGLSEAGANILGTPIEAIDLLEDREKCNQLLARLNIPHIQGKTIDNARDLEQTIDQLAFPVIVRPSYVIGGQAMFIFHHADQLRNYVEELEKKNDPRIWPLLVDPYLSGLECEADVISDGKEILIPGIFEHIERAGVHSGDSTAIFPARSLSPQIKRQIAEYARQIAQALPIIGIMNIQFILSEEKLYVLEVNPRASRTVPIMSKVTQVPMIEWATFVQLGIPLDKCAKTLGLLPEPSFTAVKAPVFSHIKLNGVDPALGPEMKSTGEILGLGATDLEALAKVFLPVKHAFATNANKPYVLCSISNAFKQESLPILKMISEKGYSLLATPGTGKYLRQHGVDSILIEKDLHRIEEYMIKGLIQSVVNIPTQGRKKERFGFQLRHLALKHQIPCFTSVDLVKAVLQIPNQIKENVQTIEEYAGRRN